MPRSEPQSLRYSPALDGVRGVAVTLVILFHGAGQLVPGGYLGVSSFFSLSGFLITSLLLLERERTGRIDLARFWGRRLRRLMPAALLGIALAATFVLVAGSVSQRASFLGDGIAALAYGANFRAMGAGASYWEMFSRPSPLQHYWSLSIEEQFYLFYPLLVLGVARLFGGGRRALQVVLLGLAVASTVTMIVLARSGASSGRLYFGTDTRAVELLSGALLATFLARDGELRPWRGRGYVVVTLACLGFVGAAIALADEDAPFLYRGGLTLYALATAGVLNAALVPGIVRWVLSLRPLVLLGRVSYGVYVYHWPVDLYLDETRTGLGGMPLLLVQVSVTLVLAVVSWVLVERPVRVASGVLGRRARLALPVAVTAVTALVLVAGREAEVSWINDRQMPEVGPRAPVGPLRILVFGDSLAFNVGAGLAAWARETGGQAVVWNLAYYRCGLFPQPGDETRRDFESDACGNWPSFWQQRIDRFEPDAVVISSGLWDLVPRPLGAPDALRPGDPEFDRGLLAVYRRAVDLAASSGARVVWVNTPCMGHEGRNRMLAAAGVLEPATIAHLNGTLLPALAASRPALRVFDLFGMVCPGGRFVRSVDGLTRTRADAHHLTADASRDVARRIVSESLPDLVGPELAAAAARAGRRRGLPGPRAR